MATSASTTRNMLSVLWCSTCGILVIGEWWGGEAVG
jgi:hypothetical protein